jgi:two-component system, OmpR family, response regulator
MMRILLVEDEPKIQAELTAALKQSGYLVDCVSDGDDAWFLGDTEEFDGVILDLGLQGLDGLTVLTRWRAAGRTMPVIILTARGRWSERVIGIDAGADDYLPKPFEMPELLARLRAIMRRVSGLGNPVLSCGDLTIDTRHTRVSMAGAPMAVTPLEYRLLVYLLHNPGRVISQIELTEHLYSQDFERDSNAIEALVARLRRKIGGDTIKTRRGYGYVIGDAEP